MYYVHVLTYKIPYDIIVFNKEEYSMLICMMLLDTEVEKRLFEKLYKAHRQSMYAYAFSILKEERAAEDAVHNVFVRITNSMEKLEKLDEAMQKGYLLTAVRHAAIDMKRKRRRCPEISLDEVPEELLATYDITSQEKEVIRMLVGLPVIYREVLQYKYVYECNNREIAAALGISEGTVRKRLERAKDLLRKRMSHE